MKKPVIRTAAPANAESYSELDEVEGIRDRIERVVRDIAELEQFYNIEISPHRTTRLQTYYDDELTALKKVNFNSLDQQGKVDYLLLKNHLERNERQLGLDAAKDKKLEPLLPFAAIATHLCEARQQMQPMNGKNAAENIHEIGRRIAVVQEEVLAKAVKMDKTSAFRAAGTIDKLQQHLAEWYAFYNGYDPIFSWWVAAPYAKMDEALNKLSIVIKEEL
jgi:uncharacterized protein (DUF885 family)